MTEQIKTPALCVGCLACHNAGRSLGKWVTVYTAAEEMAAQVYTDATEPLTITYGGQGESAEYPNGAKFTRCCRCGGDEWDVFDWEHVPHGLRNLMAFYGSAEELADADDLDALLAFSNWMDIGGAFTSYEELQDAHLDRYRGEWETFREFAEEEATNNGWLDDMPEHLRPYFDWDAYARDLEHDFYHDGVHVWAAY